MVYPVGALYLSLKNTDPGTLFGGTWMKLTDGFLFASGSIYDHISGTSLVNDEYGNLQGGAITASAAVPLPAHTHTGTTSTNGAHTHTYGSWYPRRASDGSKWPTADNAGDYTTSSNGDHNHTFTTDTAGSGDGSHQHRVPYRQIHMWVRTA